MTDRADSWLGVYAYMIIQIIFIIIKLIKLVIWSWWIIFSPTWIILMGGILFAIYFCVTCNPRIEREER